MECAPTVRGEIRKARASNYDINSAINEFIDNALDAGCLTILIDVREILDDDGQSAVHKILISDDSVAGVQRDCLRQIFSWTFERDRNRDEIGEFGTGFKSASVNIASKLTILTRSGENGCVQAVADWQDMSERNVWIPVILDIDESFFRSYHPFQTGTTLMLESIRHEFFQQQKGNDSFLERLHTGVSASYKYYLKKHPDVSIVIRGIFDGRISDRRISYTNPNPHLCYWFENAPFTIEARVLIFRSGTSYEVFLHRDTTTWETIEFVEKRKNGNNVLKATQVHPHKNRVLIDTLVFRSCTYYDGRHEPTLLESRGTVDVIRNNRVLARDVAYRAHRSDPHVAYIKHELVYSNKRLNQLLGIQFNKSNGVIGDGDIRYTLEYIQKLHEKELIRLERQKIGRVVTREKNEDNDFLDLNTTTTKDSMLPEAVHPRIQEIQKEDEKQPKTTVSITPSIQDQEQSITTHRIITKSEEPDLFEPPPVVKRKHFSIETKLEVIKKQECRDREFDFRLTDDVLPIDFDHRNGEASNNSSDNCQALSVITHSLKTRRPLLYEECRRDPVAYITRLLNCITASKYFVGAYRDGLIRVRSFDELNEREGLFFISK